MSSNKKNAKKKGGLAKTVRKVRGERSRMVKERKRNDRRPSGFGKLEDVVGTVSMGRGGYGFVTVEGRKDDIFIPEKKMHSALSGDTVRVAIKSRRGKPSNSGSNSFEQRDNGQHLEG
ncbi:MAG: hypothetical protein KBS89_05300, partial [Bacteroidales bacterium]|nr:hypothetical protein [Candidatus Egerieousia equi]